MSGFIGGKIPKPGASFEKPATPAASFEKPADGGVAAVPKMEKLPWWDTAKNSMGKMGKGFGLTTHEITTDDYVWNPKKKKFEFDWKVARENDKKRGLATST